VFHDGFGELPFKLERKTYERSDLDGAFLVYVCTENEALNARVKDDARSLGIMACVCDNSALCDFISPAIYQSGDVTVAVSTGGRDVRRSIAIRNRIGELMQNGEL
jgi:siroheme synthase-like protein